MPITLNHHIILAKDKKESANFLTRLLGLNDPVPQDGQTPDFFLRVDLANGFYFLFAEVSHEFSIQHYAFLVSEKDFDSILEKIKNEKIEYWADPGRQRPGEYYEERGERGLYFLDPSGHAMEILTVPEEI